jgi:DNA-binding transcriptional ArsR family regulator
LDYKILNTYSKAKIVKFRSKIFRSLSDPVRLEILECLHNGEKCVHEIISHIGIKQSAVSRHLAILRNCGLVKHRKHGNRRYYSVTDPAVFRVIDAVDAEFLEALSKRVIEQIV